MKTSRKFKIVLFGYSKDEVNHWITKVLDDFDERLREKEEEINQMNHQLRSLTIQHEEYVKHTQAMLPISQIEDNDVKEILNQLKTMEALHKSIKEKLIKTNRDKMEL